jgi:hypothetical protein
MAGLDPAIHVFPIRTEKGVDARVKPGHDDGENGIMQFTTVDLSGPISRILPVVSARLTIVFTPPKFPPAPI